MTPGIFATTTKFSGILCAIEDNLEGASRRDRMYHYDVLGVRNRIQTPVNPPTTAQLPSVASGYRIKYTTAAAPI